jgi:hypothetical protein
VNQRHSRNVWNESAFYKCAQAMPKRKAPREHKNNRAYDHTFLFLDFLICCYKNLFSIFLFIFIVGASLSEPHSLVAHRGQAQCIMVRSLYVRTRNFFYRLQWFKSGQYNLQTADRRLQTADCRLQTKYKQNIGINCRLKLQTWYKRRTVKKHIFTVMSYCHEVQIIYNFEFCSSLSMHVNV